MEPTDVKKKDTTLRGKQLGIAAEQPIAKSPLPEGFSIVDKRIEDFCDRLMSECWMPCTSRPKHGLYGCYVIGRWIPKEQHWAILYCGQGVIRDLLGSNFSRRPKSPIAKYLSSFPRELRYLLKIKWLKDDYYPHKVVDFDQLLSVLAVCYNDGDQPAFNQVLKESDSDGGNPPKSFTSRSDYKVKTTKYKKH